MERNIVEIDGLKYQAHKETTINSCESCAFENGLSSLACGTVKCTPNQRSDGKYVIYKLVKETK